MYISNAENEALKAERKYKPKYVRLCVDMLGAIESKMVELSDGEYMIFNVEISFCPFCGKKLQNFEKIARGDLESEE
jgi:hypothetical protein